MSWNKENTVFIQASRGFLYEGSISEGFQTFHPYKDNNLFTRVLREICFRVPVLPKQIWYTDKFVGKDINYIVVWDTLITKEYLNWLKEKFPEAKIIYKYTNMVGKANHLHPEEVPDGIELWTYDAYDSKKYKLHLQHSLVYFPSFLKPLKEPQYDLFFIGKDKGRGDKLIEFEKKLNSMGIKTKFIITADRATSKKKDYYQKEISYSHIIDYLTESKAVLNITMENQQGLTVRDMESAFLGIKLITTNKHIKNSILYCKENVFILGEDKLEELSAFINIPMKPVSRELLSHYTLDNLVEEMTK